MRNRDDLYESMLKAWKKVGRGGTGLLGYLLLGMVIILIAGLVVMFVPTWAARLREWAVQLKNRLEQPEPSDVPEVEKQ